MEWELQKDENTHRTLQFADDQVILVPDEEGLEYMMRKVKEECE